MKVLVKILPKPEVLDSAGRATFNALSEGRKNLINCRLGKLVELEFDSSVAQNQALEQAQNMAHELLINPLVESFELEVKK